MARRRGRIPPGGYINAPNRMRGDPFYQTAAWRKFRDAVVAERGMRCEDKEHPPGKRVEQSRFGSYPRAERRRSAVGSLKRVDALPWLSHAQDGAGCGGS
jgi:hypothetical protein